jgi:hypothetical protein
MGVYLHDYLEVKHKVSLARPLLYRTRESVRSGACCISQITIIAHRVPIIVNIGPTLKRAVMAAAAAIALCTAPMASADPFGTQGYVAGSESFLLSIGGVVSAGGFAGTWNGQGITFWCIELTQHFGFGNTYADYLADVPGNPVMTLLGRLFNEAYGMATVDAAHSAAFQLAIWEIVYDPNNLNLAPGAGVFSVLGGNPGTVSIAQGWLSNLGSYADTYDLILLHSRDHQDFVTFGTPFTHLQRIPEPVSAGLLALAFLAMFVVLRRGPKTVTA